jgi:hypothetical protein
MTCYVVPTTIALLSVIFRRKFSLHTKYAQWFTMMFSGGSVFGFVDHLWNGELLLIGPNIANDLLLGAIISAALLVGFIISVKADKASLKSLANG